MDIEEKDEVMMNGDSTKHGNTENKILKNCQKITILKRM